MSRAFIALILLSVASPAFAQDRPPLKPTRDATVTYRTLGRDAGVKSMRISQAAGLPVMRVEADQMPGYALVNREAGRTTVVMAEQKTYMDVAAERMPAQARQLPDKDSRYTRKGTDTVAGTKCNVWDYSNPRGAGTACITAEGILLRALGGDGSGIEATAISYTAMPTAAYYPPAGFQRMDMPNFAGGAAGGMPGGITLPPGFKLPPGVTLPPGFTLPPGVTLPPGLAPGMVPPTR